MTTRGWQELLGDEDALEALWTLTRESQRPLADVPDGAQVRFGLKP